MNWRHPQVQKSLGLGDVLVFQRNVITPDTWEAMDYWRALGKTVCIDADDHYTDLPPSNPAHAYWTRNIHGMNPDPVSALAEAMKHASAFTSPSKILVRDWEHIVPGYWIPNYTRRVWYEKLQQKPVGAVDLAFSYEANDKGERVFNGRERPDSKGWVTLGWGGSISHVDSWIYSGAIEAITKLFDKYPNLRLKFCGHEERLNYLFEKWGDRVIRQSGVTPEHWPFVISSFDIGLAPLDLRPLDPPWREGGPINSYDERRSWLKGIEYLCAGVPWVASKSATYNDLARWGTLVDNTPDAWFSALDNKIQHLQAEKALAWDRRRWAFKKVTMEGNVDHYANIFGRIIADTMTRGNKKNLPGVTYVERNAVTA